MKKLTDINKSFAKLDVEKLLGNEMKGIKGGCAPKCSNSCYPGCSPGCSTCCASGGMYAKDTLR